MLIKQLAYPSGGAQPYGGYETIDFVFTNVQGATITTGFPISFTTTAASVDGISAVLPAAGNLLTFSGISLQDVPNNGVGLARSWGLCNSIAVFATGSSGSVAAGAALGPGSASLGVNSTGNITLFGPVVNMVSYGAAVNSAGGYTRGFVRAM
jgi:hypothetical protein